MPDIQITVAGKIATNMSPGVVIICGNSGYRVAFDFDDEWANNPNKTARFTYTQGGRTYYKEQPFTGSSVAVPILSNIRQVEVGVYAGNLRTTTPAVVLCKRSILCGDAVEQITPEEKAGLVAQLGDLNALETEDKSSLVAAVNEVKRTGGGGGGGGRLPLPSNAAEVGQYIAVAAVDENGVVTATEAVTPAAGSMFTTRARGILPEVAEGYANSEFTLSFESSAVGALSE